MNKAVKIVKEEKIDFILAVGGGSVIDGCKYLAAASLYDGDGWDFLDGTKEVEKALPLGVVLTLAATGSESNNLTVLSKKQTDEKRMYFSNYSYPQFAIMDPSVMATLSDRQLGNGLVDAFVHTSEQYLTHPTTALVNDGYAETLFRGLVKLADTWENRRTYTWLENLMHPPAPGRPLRLQVFVDACSVELFADQGLAVITELVLPGPASMAVATYSQGGLARFGSGTAWALQRCMHVRY